MSVRKPLEKIEGQEIDIDELISKGAPVKEDIEFLKKQWMYINLRIPVEMVKQIDIELEERLSISRTAWILETLQERLKREI